MQSNQRTEQPRGSSSNGRPPNASGPTPITAQWIAMYMTILLEAIMRLASSFTRSANKSRSIDPPPTMPGLGYEGRSIASYINSGLTKVERARRTSAVNKQYRNAARTISLTRQAIRATPRRHRGLFKGYGTLLDETSTRLKWLNREIHAVDQHVRAYDPHTIREEIQRLQIRAANDSSGEINMLLISRQEMLESIESFEARMMQLINKVSALAARLELNHMRVVSIAGRIIPQGGEASLEYRMDEVTEQLSLLEESLRELDRT